MKPTRKVSQVPQPSDPMKHVTDEAIHKELGDSLVRAATTTFSLGAEQDNGNIAKTQSKATPNESSSQGTDSGNTLRSDKDRMKLNELMALCITLQNMVLELEKTKTSQHNEIASLKRRVKKLEKRNRLRTHKLKRLYKVCLTARVESSDNKESLGGEKVFAAAGQNENVVNINTKELTLSQALEALKFSKPKVKGLVIQEPEEPMKPKKKDQIKLDEEAAKRLQAKLDEEARLAKEKEVKEQEANITLIKTWDDIQAKINVDHQLAARLQAKEQAELTELVKRKEKRAREELIQKSIKKQKVEEDKEIADLKQLMEIIPDKEEVAIDDWKIYKEGKKSYYQIVRADGKSQMHMVFS
nr:hypothetical protein [Tanacetum cinerariifolium]